MVGGTRPTGTVAYLLCDVVASARQWEDEPETVTVATKQIAELLDRAVAAHHGVRAGPPTQTRTLAVFARASDAVLAALDTQRAVIGTDWPRASPVQARMAVTTGDANLAPDGSYVGLAVARTAHLCDLAHGEQVLVSATAREVAIDRLDAPVTLVDLGRHRLRDLTRPERIFQLADPSLPSEFPPLRSLDRSPNNLPIQLTSFIGRTDELTRISKLLDEHRLVTIAGGGGAGKTRLAQHVGARVIDRHPDGVWWVELADRRDAESVTSAVAAAMGMQASAGSESEALLAARLADRELLLVLDNCEHVLEPAIRLVTELVQRAPSVDVLVTSREPLAVPGELIWQIPQLTTPDPTSGASAAELTAYEAIQLFVDRAQRVRPNFRLNDDNADALAAICRRLDGIPLALELAASRCRALTPAEILKGLVASLDVLVGSGRAGPPRHHTLAASMQWSHQLLRAPEQTLLRRVAVFSGGCTLNDAERVVTDDELPVEAVLDALEGLVAQSLVQFDDTQHEGRYRLLETVRQFGVERLIEHGEHERFTTRHAEHFLALCRRVGPHLNDSRALAAFTRLAPELNNLRVTLSTLEHRERWADVMSVVYDSALAWHVLAAADAADHLTRVIDHEDLIDAVTRARARIARALMRTDLGDYAGGLVDAQAASAQDDDPVASARAAMTLASAMGLVDITVGDAMLEDAAAAMNPAATPLDVAAPKWCRAFFNMCWGDAQLGHRLAEEMLPEVQRLDNPLTSAFALAGLAWGLCVIGDYRRATAVIDEADRHLAAVSSAVGIDRDQLIGAWSGGAQLETARALVREATEALPERVDRVSRFTRVGRVHGSVVMHTLLGTIEARHLHMTGDTQRAAVALTELVDAASAAGASYFASIALATAAECARQTDDVTRAQAALAQLENLGPRYRTPYSWIRARYTRARIRVSTGDATTAEETVRTALVDARASGYLPEVAIGFGVLSSLAADNERYVEAARLAGAAQRLRDDIGLVCDFERVRDDVEAGMIAARRVIGSDDVAREHEDGYRLDPEAAVAYAQRPSER